MKELTQAILIRGKYDEAFGHGASSALAEAAERRRIDVGSTRNPLRLPHLKAGAVVFELALHLTSSLNANDN